MVKFMQEVILLKKTYKYRLFPTKSQRTKLNNTLEICRQVYNQTLGTRKEAWEQEKKSISLYDSHKMLTKWKVEKPEWKQVHSQVLQNVQERVDLAYKAFFRRVKAGQEPGYPRFKGYGRYDSFTFPQSGFSLNSDILKMSKIGEVKINLHRPIGCDISTLTIQRDRLGNWYACFVCEVETVPLPQSNKVVGIDLGLTTFTQLSDGEKINRERWLKRDQKDLKRVQRKVSALPKGSSERAKAIRSLNHVHHRIKNRRDNFAHQQSRKLVDTYQVIVFEDLKIKDMQSKGNKRINYNIADVAWNSFIEKTTYKAVEAGRLVIKVNPKNTSQECSGCHKIVKKDLTVRKHNCPHCGLSIDRDLNASINILGRGLASLGYKTIEVPFL